MQDRLKEILKKENLTSSQFADKIGVQRSSISHILSGRNKPGFEFIQKILLSFPEIDANWLMTGLGKIYSESTHASTLFNENGDTATSSPVADIPLSTGPDATTKRKEADIRIEQPKKIEKIMVFYKDKTFIEYLPENF